MQDSVKSGFREVAQKKLHENKIMRKGEGGSQSSSKNGGKATIIGKESLF